MNKNRQYDHIKVYLGFVHCGCAMAILLLALAGCGTPNIERLKEQENYSRLIDILLDRDQDPFLRIESAKALGHSNDKESVDALLKTFTMNNSTRSLRFACKDSLVQIGNPEVVEGLIDVIFEKPWGEETLVSGAKSALVKIGKPTLDVIEESYQKTIRAEVTNVQTLTLVYIQIADKDAFEFLSKAWLFSCPLISEDPRPGGCSRYYEKYIRPMVGPDKIDSETLISFLKGDDPEFQQLAAYTLRYVNGTEVTEALLEAYRDEDLEIRSLAASSLIDQNPQKGAKILVELIQENDQDKIECVSEFILGADNPVFTEIDDEDYSTIVDFLIHRNSSVLKQIIDERAEAPLLDALNHSNPDVREYAATVLKFFDGEKVISSLVLALQDEDNLVVANATRSLEWIGNAEALLPYLDRENPQVTDQIFSNIWNILFNLRSESIEDDLIDALWKFGGPSMANRFYNCGDPDLRKVAEEWAHENGYFFLPNPIPSP